MLEKSPLAKVERALSNAWGGDVHLAFLSNFEEHPHDVAQLTVVQAPIAMPATVLHQGYYRRPSRSIPVGRRRGQSARANLGWILINLLPAIWDRKAER